jgi:hypothetical protein
MATKKKPATLEDLRAENAQLRKDLSVAHEKVAEQATTLELYDKELKRAFVLLIEGRDHVDKRLVEISRFYAREPARYAKKGKAT